MQNEKAVPCKKQKSCKQKAVLSQISAAFSLTPMEWPWHYLHGLQAEFDLSKLKFTEDFYDPDMNPNAPERKEDWKVYFNGTSGGITAAGARRWNANTRSALILPQASF